MDDDEFAELYGSSPVDEPFRPTQALVNGMEHTYFQMPLATTD